MAVFLPPFFGSKTYLDQGPRTKWVFNQTTYGLRILNRLNWSMGFPSLILRTGGTAAAASLEIFPKPQITPPSPPTLACYFSLAADAVQLSPHRDGRQGNPRQQSGVCTCVSFQIGGFPHDTPSTLHHSAPLIDWVGGRCLRCSSVCSQVGAVLIHDSDVGLSARVLTSPGGLEAGGVGRLEATPWRGTHSPEKHQGWRNSWLSCAGKTFTFAFPAYILLSRMLKFW